MRKSPAPVKSQHDLPILGTDINSIIWFTEKRLQRPTQIVLLQTHDHRSKPSPAGRRHQRFGKRNIIGISVFLQHIGRREHIPLHIAILPNAALHPRLFKEKLIVVVIRAPVGIDVVVRVKAGDLDAAHVIKIVDLDAVHDLIEQQRFFIAGHLLIFQCTLKLRIITDNTGNVHHALEEHVDLVLALLQLADRPLAKFVADIICIA